MSNALIRGMTNVTRTENGAPTLRSTHNPLLDYFAVAAASRGRDITPLFREAWKHDRVRAIKTLFYIRDVRGGQGERKTFREGLAWLKKHDYPAFRAVLPLVPEYGRWDDIIAFVEDEHIVNLVDAQLADDLASNRPSLLGKWLPSENASSRATRALARKWITALGTTARNYRLMLGELRRKLRIVERDMSANEWGAIEYSHVPSRAGMLYRKAFKKRDGERYAAYLASVSRGEKKINAGVLYPYEIFERLPAVSPYIRMDVMDVDPALELLWKALPDYTNGSTESAIVVADVSGSMAGRPMDVSTSLAVYFAERTRGPFRDHFITFSANPNLAYIDPSMTLAQRKAATFNGAGYNTNLQAVFDLILRTAVREHVAQADMPAKIFVVSDMEFDDPQCNGQRTNFEVIKAKYAAAGYAMPTLVFWNVAARNTHVPVTQNEHGVYLVSGCSPSIFKAALNTQAVTPVDLMLEVIDADRYAPVGMVLGDMGEWDV